MAAGARWHLWRGADPAVLQQLEAAGIDIADYGPLMSAWQIMHPGAPILLRMPQVAGQGVR